MIRPTCSGGDCMWCYIRNYMKTVWDFFFCCFYVDVYKQQDSLRLVSCRYRQRRHDCTIFMCTCGVCWWVSCIPFVYIHRKRSLRGSRAVTEHLCSMLSVEVFCRERTGSSLRAEQLSCFVGCQRWDGAFCVRLYVYVVFCCVFKGAE